MELTLLCTGSPVPVLDRGGTSLLLSIADEYQLIDCGPMTVRRLLEAEVDMTNVESLYFTHQHVDHNADFFNFVISSWSMGRRSLSMYGPAGTDRLLDSLYSIYEEDLEYRKEIAGSGSGIEDISLTTVDGGVVVDDDDFHVTAQRVDHSIETYAYRFEEKSSGRSVVFSGDSRKIPELAEFATGADVLVQDAGLAPVDDDHPDDGYVWERLTEPYSDEQWEKLHRTHCTAEEAGEIAAAAGVDRLLLTHLLPYRDLGHMEAAAAEAFDGEVRVARDGMSVSI